MWIRDFWRGRSGAIFWRTWQIVARSEQLRNPGDYVTAELLGEPLLLVRGAENKLRGFYNVCRHRAGPPAEGCGTRKLFRCGYHGWTYGLDGRLLNAPEMEGTADFRAEDFALRPVHVGEWQGLVFVNLDPDAEPLHTALRELPGQAAKYDMQNLRLAGRGTIPCNATGRCTSTIISRAITSPACIPA